MTAPIVPDTKDWTWVLERACPECGFTAADADVATLGTTIREISPRWVSALSRPDVRDRPAPGTWSVLEYGAHVRDVHRVFDERVRLMLTQDDPGFPNWDQDETAVADRYDLQDPTVVGDQLVDAADTLAATFDGVPPEAWDRVGHRSNGSVFTVRTLGQYFLHDVVHHLRDVRA